jgi:cold shock CspA family protein
MVEGVVSWFDPRHGTGSIVTDDGAEVAVRASSIAGGGRQSLRPGDRVAFVLFHGPDGAAASDVHVP